MQRLLELQAEALSSATAGVLIEDAERLIRVADGLEEAIVRLVANSQEQAGSGDGDPVAARQRLHHAGGLIDDLSRHRQAVRPTYLAIEAALSDVSETHRGYLDDLNEARWISTQLGEACLELRDGRDALRDSDERARHDALLADKSERHAEAQANELRLKSAVELAGPLIIGIERLVARLNRHIAALDIALARLRLDVEMDVIVCAAETPDPGDVVSGYVGEVFALHADGLVDFIDVRRRRERARSLYEARFSPKVEAAG